MKIIWATPASKQLAAALDYLEETDPNAALGLGKAIIQTLERITTFPYSGRIGIVSGTREAIIGKYILVYEVCCDQINIVYFYHGAMQYPPITED